ncbi:MAG: PVC-type heme-binding CxxCH protein [Planctomycetaceae bacterium]
MRRSLRIAVCLGLCLTAVGSLLWTSAELDDPSATLFAAKPKPSSKSPGRDAKDAVKSLDVPKDLEATLFASEPVMKSPSNIDVDHLGRVWVCDIVNYRHFRNRGNPVRKAGDRILSLEDTDGDGKADKSAVFYQGRDIDSAHGVCVLGTPTGKNTRVIVSAGDSVFILTDKDGDLKADKKDVLFTGISGTQHDHGIHAFVFGPDGRLYFNFGNEGRQIRDKNGKPITDKAGNLVNGQRKPYQQGMVFRCKLDGSELETLAWNFRNNWELAVDSFGTIWQSDNDDDGNRGVRINYVMEYGNYGYKDELTGAGWRSPRTGMHAEVPKRHWHLNDPGVMPNLLQTYAGSPTGICVYEGKLLPKRFLNQLIHCDAGPNVVRSYAVTNSGAGYTATINPILTGTRDKWFRPSDVCVAPDGSLIVADWYDPGVGGHRQGDVTRGRLFRVAPPKTPYRIPKHNFRTVAGLIAALKSPNTATRTVAWRALHQMGAQAEEPLKELFAGSTNPRHRARALWLLGNIEVCGQHYVEKAITDKNANIRIQAVRLARQIGVDMPAVLKELVHDPSPQVRRECAVALREMKGKDVPKFWTALALQHDGNDRWYLEALGIAARGRWNACLSAWLKKVGGNWNTPAGRDIVWRARSSLAIPYLAKIILDPRTDSAARLRYFRAFDFHQPKAKSEIAMKRDALLQLATASHKQQVDITSLALKHLGSVDLSKSPKLKAAVEKAIDAATGTDAYVRMVAQLNLTERYPELLAMAQKQPDEQLGVEAIRALLARKQFRIIRGGLNGKDETRAVATATALGNSADGRIVGLLRPFVNDRKRPIAVRRQAVRAMAKTRNGAKQLLAAAQRKRIDKPLTQAVAAALHGSPDRNVKSAAAKLFPLPASKNNKPLPPIAVLLTRRGNIDRGRVVFNTVGTCVKCHRVNGVGKDVGPDLSEIGKKLSRTAMIESIVFPSAGISHNYETYVVALESGNQVTGVLTSRTKASITLKGADAISRTFKTSDIELIKKQTVSLMPADL